MTIIKMEKEKQEEKSNFQVSLPSVGFGEPENNADVLAEGRFYKLNEVNSMKKK